MSETRYAIMVDTPGGPKRMQSRYRTKACAKSWLSFVKAAWRSKSAWVVKVEAERKVGAK